MNDTKICTKCNEKLPATLEYFYEHKIVKSGLRSDCIKCVRKRQLEYLNKMTPEARYEMKKSERQRNSHVYRQATRKQVAIKRGVIHEDWTEEQLLSIYGTDCYICSEPIDFNAPKRGIGSDHSFWPDHMTPTSRGGSNTINNVRPCHRKCNQNKYTMTYDEYIKSLDKDNEL